MRRIVLIFLLFAPVLAGAQQRVVSLEECKSLASSNDPYLRNAGLDVLAARAQKQEALAAYFPSVSATALAFHAINPLVNIGVTDVLGDSDAAWNISNWVDENAPQYGLPTRYEALHYGYGATLTLTQPLFAGGRIVNGNRLASLGVEAAQLQQSLRGRQTDASVEEKYWRVVSLQEKQITLDHARELLDSLSKDAASALAAGLLTETDCLQVSLKLSELRAAQVQLSGGMRLAKMDLFNAIGLEYASISAVAGEDRPFIDDIVLSGELGDFPSPQECYIPEEELAAGMEETRLLDLQVEAKTLEKKMAVGEALPQVGLGAMYGYSKMVGDGRSNGMVYAMVSIPLSDWGKNARRIERYGYEVEKARNERDYLDAQLILSARKLWVDLETAWEQMEVAAEAVAFAQRIYDSQLAQFEAGLATMSDLLQTQTSLRQSEDSFTDACINYRVALNSYQALQR